MRQGAVLIPKSHPRLLAVTQGHSLPSATGTPEVTEAGSPRPHLTFSPVSPSSPGAPRSPWHRRWGWGLAGPAGGGTGPHTAPGPLFSPQRGWGMRVHRRSALRPRTTHLPALLPGQSPRPLQRRAEKMSPPVGGGCHLPPSFVLGHSLGPLGPLGGRVALANRPHRHPGGQESRQHTVRWGRVSPPQSRGGGPTTPLPSRPWVQGCQQAPAGRGPQADPTREQRGDSSAPGGTRLPAAPLPFAGPGAGLTGGPGSPRGAAPSTSPGGPCRDRGELGEPGVTAPRLSPSQGG